LLKKRADVNAQGGRFDDALIATIRGWHQKGKVVQLYVDHKAEIKPAHM
jgi:hypothetical protein